MKKIMMLAAALAVALVMAGCAGTMSEEDQRKHTTVFVTMKVIEESSLTADDVLEMVADVRGGAQVDTSPEELRAKALEELGFDELSPADRYLASLLVEPLLTIQGDEVDLGDEIGVGNDLAELEQWLDWVEQAAHLSGGGGDQ